jgi:hypothetical protein
MRRLLIVLPMLLSAAVVDRVAVVVGKAVFTESEVLEEIRLTAFQGQEPLDLSPKARRAAAERLVDQQLIRNEMEIGSYLAPSDADVDRMLVDFRSQRFRTESEYRAALARYGITEPELKEHLRWELAALRFTDQRFRLTAQAPPAQGADRAAPGTDQVEENMEAWLKEARSQTKIQFKKEAFQ